MSEKAKIGSITWTDLTIENAAARGYNRRRGKTDQAFRSLPHVLLFPCAAAFFQRF